MAAPYLVSGPTGSGNITSGDLTVTLPAHQTDDILVVMISYRGLNTTSGTDEPSDPSGWTKIDSYISGSPLDYHQALYYKRAASGSETDPVFVRPGTWDTGTDTSWGGASWVVRNCVTSGTPYDAVAADEGRGTAGETGSPTVSGVQRLTIWFSQTPAVGLTIRRFDGNVNPSTDHIIQTKATTSGGATSWYHQSWYPIVDDIFGQDRAAKNAYLSGPSSPTTTYGLSFIPASETASDTVEFLPTSNIRRQDVPAALWQVVEDSTDGGTFSWYTQGAARSVRGTPGILISEDVLYSYGEAAALDGPRPELLWAPDDQGYSTDLAVLAHQHAQHGVANTTQILLVASQRDEALAAQLPAWTRFDWMQSMQASSYDYDLHVYVQARQPDLPIYDYLSTGTDARVDAVAGVGAVFSPAILLDINLGVTDVTGTGTTQSPSVNVDSSTSPDVATGTGSVHAPAIAVSSILSVASVDGTGSTGSVTPVSDGVTSPALTTGTGATGSVTTQSDAAASASLVTGTGATPFPDVSTTIILTVASVSGIGTTQASTGNASVDVAGGLVTGTGSTLSSTQTTASVVVSDLVTGTGATFAAVIISDTTFSVGVTTGTGSTGSIVATGDSDAPAGLVTGSSVTYSVNADASVGVSPGSVLGAGQALSYAYDFSWGS